MASAPEDVQRDLDAAASATQHFKAWMVEFQSACVRGDGTAIERTRQMVVWAMEAHLDAISAAYMRIAG